MKKYWSLTIYILVGLLAFVWLIKVPILSYYFSQKLRVPVRFNWVSIWPRETAFTHLRIENPKEFSSPTALKVDKTKVHYFFENVFKDPTIINEIEMDNVYLGVEFLVPGEEKNNWTIIARDIPRSTSRHSFIINRMVLTNLTIVISNVDAMGKVLTRYVDRLEINQINSNRGFPTEKVIQEIFGGVHLDDLIKDVFNPFELFDL